MAERHKKILNVSTFVYNGKQKVELEVEGLENKIYLSPANIKQNTNIDINEVEILIGSTIRPTFYKKGEKMLNDKICKDDNTVINDFWITLLDTIPKLREINKNHILPLKKIVKVFQFTREEDIVGFELENEDNPFYIKSYKLERITNLEPSEFHILTNSYIAPIYYKKGEVLKQGDIVRKDNRILKKLNIRFSGTIDEMHKNYKEPEQNNNYHEEERFDDRETYSYEQYGGPSDGYGGMLDDDFINDALGGEPDAIWNID